MLKRFCLFLVLVLSLSVAVREASTLSWHSGKALVLYTQNKVGWVQGDYKDNEYWAPFRERFTTQGWTVSFTMNVDGDLLEQYDALFILTPVADIPNDEVSAIVEWVKDGGQLLVTEDDRNFYANELIEHFGFTSTKKSTVPAWHMTSFDYNDNLTTLPHRLEDVFGHTVQDIAVKSPARCLGWDGPLHSRCYLAINDQVEKGIVIAVGEESMWLGIRFDAADNANLLDNVLKRFHDHSSFTVPPVANGGGPYSGVEGSPIMFDAGRSSDSDGYVALYEWDWNGDGVFDDSSASARTSHVFHDDFDGSVYLRVTDDDGAQATAGVSVRVNNVAPTAHGGGPYTGQEGRGIQLFGRATDPGADTFTYEWDFNYDGTTFHPDSNEQNATATYDDDGVFTVGLRVTDDDGGVSAVYRTTVTVSNAAPIVTMASPFTGDEGAPVTFSLSIEDATNDTHTVMWSFGDGSSPVLGSITATHRYGDNGDYTVTATVTDDDGASTTASGHAIISNVAPTVAIVAANPIRVRPQVTVTLVGNYTDPGQLDTHTVEWDFGDGTRIVDASLTVTHVYLSLIPPRTYTITLTVTDSDGASGSARVHLVPETQVPLPSEWVAINALLITSTVTLMRFCLRKPR